MTDAKRLFNAGENLRAEQPALWAILRGKGATFRIALLLGWTEKMVAEELADLAKQGVVKQNSQGTWYLVKGSEHHELYIEIRKLYRAIDQRIAENNPGKIELSEVAPTVRAVIKEAQAIEKAEQKKIPTEVQWKLLQAAWNAFGREPFTALDLAKAQGYTQAGWSKKYIETLVRKGYVEMMYLRGRAQTWQLTDAGVEWGQK